jgi:hypothetical protein
MLQRRVPALRTGWRELCVLRCIRAARFTDEVSLVKRDITISHTLIFGWCLVAGSAFFLSAHAARAQEYSTQTNPLGFYLGAGIGTSTIRQDPEGDTSDLGMARRTVGGDVFAGIRPLPYLGAEIGYLDFGSTHEYDYTPTPLASNDVSRLHESANAPVAFGVGYIPLQPWWDLYVKAGAARLHKSWDVLTPAECPAGGCFAGYSGGDYFSGEDSTWAFAYGIGSQVNFGPVAWRLEYVRVNATGNLSAGDPDLLSVGVSWTFF